MTTLPAWSSVDGARRAVDAFGAAYDAAPVVVAMAPGRVNLIGEHTDYNQGLCLPIALPHATYAAARLRADGRVRLVSGDGPIWSSRVEELGSADGWAAYAGGVVWALGEAGHRVPGLDLAVAGCVPVGAGLSSSAALECAVGVAVADLLGLPDHPDTRRLVAAAGIRAENQVAGAATGGLDQTIAMRGRAGHALLLDCRTWATEQVPCDPAADGLELLVVDTRVHHALNDGGYGARRSDCELAAATLGVASLRDASIEDLVRLADERVRRRARHVITEIGRVTAATAALQAGRWSRFGELMIESHASMRDDFEISCPELDTVVEAALNHGALGARMTGGGFGGSAIALLPRQQVEPIRDRIDSRFAEQGWAEPAYLAGRASEAARALPLP